MTFCGSHLPLWAFLVAIVAGFFLSVGLIRAFGLWGLLACLILLAGGAFWLQALITHSGC